MERLAPCSEKRMNAATSCLGSSVFESSVLSFFQIETPRRGARRGLRGENSICLGNSIDAVFYGSSRGIRGGRWGGGDALASSGLFYIGPSDEGDGVGFRLASAVPEPSSLVLTMLASGVVLLRRKR